VFDREVVVPHLAAVGVGALENAEEILRDGYLTTVNLGKLRQGCFEICAEAGSSHTELVEEGIDDSIRLVQQTEEEVGRLYILVIVDLCQFLSA
jgi:hypothetical protein